MQHFLSVTDLPPDKVLPVLDRAAALKSGSPSAALAGKTAVLLFGLATLVRRAGMATPLWLLSLAGKIARGRLPATGELAQVHAPLAPPLACGALVYLWPLWLLGVG